MQFPFISRRIPTLEEIQEQRDIRSKGIHGMIKVAGIIFLVLVALIASMLLLNPILELHTLEQERARAEQQLRRAKATEAEAYNKLLWMSDPEYFEQMARDRANQAKEGEHIIRRPTAEERQQMEKEAQKKRQPRKPRRRD
ncbi:MAG: septum formation initiator family protein [Akkermansia sp.]|nr:septum formation initiator family protein [Akkermansia sp.]MBQ2868421.1 septum formation initiator family protein [Akkermansia sp.]MBQ8375516.1 septum formation initiator family protein [Akkermansia sp.]